MSGNDRLTVREACRRRMPLDGADAQALEGALQQVERELESARAGESAALEEVAWLRHLVRGLVTDLDEWCWDDEGMMDDQLWPGYCCARAALRLPPRVQG